MTQATPWLSAVGRAEGPPPAGALSERRRGRLAGIDATSGVALLGMMALHSLYSATAGERATWSYLAFAGRAAATFAVLAGVGITFMTGCRRVNISTGSGTAGALAIRGLAIGVIGLALGHADGSLGVVILPYYGVMVLLAIPLVFLPTWAVVVAGVVLAGGVPVLSHLLRPSLRVPSLDNYGFESVVSSPVALLTELSITGEYPALTFMAYLCAGVVIGRLRLTDRRVVTSLLSIGAVFAVTAWATSTILLNQLGGLGRIWAAQPVSGLSVAETNDVLMTGADGTTPTSTWWWLAVDRPHTGTSLDLLGTTGTAIALLGLMLLVGHLTHPVLRWPAVVAQAPLAAAGSMVLTFYVAHILFINSDYDIYGPGTGFLLQAGAVMLLGLAWAVTAGRGPIEALVSALSSWGCQWAQPQARRAAAEHDTVTREANP